jgi:hypothetical protein
LPPDNQLLLGVFVPALLAAFWLLLAWRPWSRAVVSDHTLGRWGAPVALTLAYAAGHVCVLGLPSWPPTEATHWVLFLALAAGALGLSESLSSRRSRWRLWLPRALLAVGAIPALLKPYVDYTWTPEQSIVWILGIALLSVGFCVELAWALPGLPGTTGWWVLVLLTSGLAVTLALWASLTLGLLAGVLAAGCGAALCVSMLARGRPIPSTLVPLLTVVLGLLILSGYLFAELPAGSALLLAAAPAAARALPESWLAGRGRLVRLALTVVAVGLPVVAVVVHAYLASPSLDPYY